LIENGIDAYAGSLADVDKNKKVDHHCQPRELVNSLLIIRRDATQFMAPAWRKFAFGLRSATPRPRGTEAV
jgi:hypothetical protein